MPEYTGVMIALMLPEKIAERLALSIPGALPADQLHLTLAFLGDSETDKIDQAAVTKAVKAFAGNHAPLSGNINGFGRFKTNEGDGDAFYATFDSPDLPEFRQDLVKALEAAGVKIVANHGFTPHITLAYIDREGDTPDIDVEPEKINFDAVTLGWANTYTPIALGASSQEAQKTYQPPEAAKNNARKVLNWREKHGDEVNGMTQVGWGRASQLAGGDPISLDIVKRMAQFNRHRKNAEVAPEYKDEPWKDAGYVAWLGWGGTSGIDWAMKISGSASEAEKKFSNVPDSMQAKMEKCVMDVKAKGKDKKAAIAICYTSVVEGEALESVMRSFEAGTLDIEGINQRVQEEEKTPMPDDENNQEGVSLDEKMDRFHRAWDAAYNLPGSPSRSWVRQIYDEDGYVVISLDSGYFQVPFTDTNGEITFAPRDQWQKVKHSDLWEKIQEAKVSDFMEIRAVEADEFTGAEWDVTLIGRDPHDSASLVKIDSKEYIRSKNGLLYSVAGLKASVPLWDGVEVFDNHLTEEEFKNRAGMRSPAQEWVGNIVKPRWDEAAKAIKGTLKIVDDKLAAKLKRAHEMGLTKQKRGVGLSIDTFPIYGAVQHEGKRMKTAEGFNEKSIVSVDVVMRPAAGGGFNRMIAAQQPTPNEVNDMDEKERLALITRLVTEALKDHQVEAEQQAAIVSSVQEAVDAAKLTEEAQIEAFAKPLVASIVNVRVVEAQQQGDPDPDPDPEPTTPPEPEPNPALEAVRALEAQIMLRDKLDEAKLPEKFRALVTDRFPRGSVFTEADVDAYIKRAKEAQTAVDPSGRVQGAGNGRGVQVTGPEIDKQQFLFMELMMGRNRFRELEGIQEHFVRERIPESYKTWINSSRPNYGVFSIPEWTRWLLGGDPFSDQHALEAVTTSSMSSLVKNALNVMIAADYARRHRWWEPIVTTEEVDTIDQATLVRLYGMSTLSVVNEGNAYTEMAWADDEETADFVKRGGYVGVTLEALLRAKDQQKIRSIPNRLATSWYNTLSNLVSGVFTVNTAAGPVLSDTGALFNATALGTAGGHANLLTTALSFAAFSAARTAMRKQTDQALGAGEKLLIDPKYLLVPVDLETTAEQIRTSEKDPDNANNPDNPYRNKFEVITVPTWTDATDWALVGDKMAYPAIYLIFLRGRMVPELFTADSEQAGAMFTNDTLRYKVRMLTYRYSSTYDCAPVSDFRPLHKSNV